jgi:hypothetical protein
MNVCLVGTEWNRSYMTKFAAIDLANRDIASYVSNNYAYIDRCEAVYVYNADGRINFDIAACIGYALAKKKVIFSFLPIGLSAIEVPVCDPDELTNQVILDEFVKNRVE